MKVGHLIPVAAKRAGGIDGFLNGLESALASRGVESEMIEEGRSLAPLPEADIYHFHGLWQPDSRALAEQILRRSKRYAVSPHGMLEPWAMRHRFWKKLPYFFLRELGFLRAASALLATSQMEQKSIRYWVKGSQPEVLPLGISASMPSREQSRATRGWRQEEKILLYLSRLHPKKGLELLLHALDQEPEASAGWRLVVVGDGIAAYEEKLKALAAKLSKVPPIDWVGAVWDDRKWQYLAGADYFCLPSHSENFGLAVLEALACGTPVITTTATPWQMIDKWPGCAIVSPTVAGLRTGLRQLPQRLAAEDRKKLQEMSLEEFGWSRLADRYVRFYSDAAGISRTATA